MTKKDITLGKEHFKKIDYALKNWDDIKAAEDGPFAHLQALLKTAQGNDSDKFKPVQEVLEEFCAAYQEFIYRSSNIEYMVKITFERDNDRTPENEEYLEKWRGEKKEMARSLRVVGRRLGAALDAAVQELSAAGVEKG